MFGCFFFFGALRLPPRQSFPSRRAEEGSSGADPFFFREEFDLLRGCRRVEGESEGDSCLYIPLALAALRPSVEAAVKAKATARSTFFYVSRGF